MQLLAILFLLIGPLLVAQAQDNDDDSDLSDDQSLVGEEFSFSQLFEQTYGLLIGYGGPRYSPHVGASYFVTDYLNLNLYFGMFGKHQTEEEDNDERKRNRRQGSKEAETMATALQLHYYPHSKLPLSVFVGGGLARWNGKFTSDAGNGKYRGWELYGKSGVAVFYFWRGFYAELVIFGLVSGHNLTLETKADKATKKDIVEEMEKLDHQGILANKWNFRVGYFL